MRGRELLELQAIVKGKVQGVGFRATVKSFAEEFKLVGFVRNLSDGNVEICAQGEKSKLEALLDKLSQEFGSYIQQIDMGFHEITQAHRQFSILK